MLHERRIGAHHARERHQCAVQVLEQNFKVRLLRAAAKVAYPIPFLAQYHERAPGLYPQGNDPPFFPGGEFRAQLSLAPRHQFKGRSQGQQRCVHHQLFQRVRNHMLPCTPGRCRVRGYKARLTPMPKAVRRLQSHRRAIWNQPLGSAASGNITAYGRILVHTGHESYYTDPTHATPCHADITVRFPIYCHGPCPQPGRIYFEGIGGRGLHPRPAAPMPKVNAKNIEGRQAPKRLETTATNGLYCD